MLGDDDVDDILDYAQYGKCVYKPDFDWSPNEERDDMIIFSPTVHDAELAKDLYFDNLLDEATQQEIIETALSMKT